jgi:hypothetical protein
MMRLTGINQLTMNRPVNIMELKEKDLKKYHQPKVGDNFQAGDLLHLIDDEYVVISKDNILMKQTISKYNKVYRKNGKR